MQRKIFDPVFKFEAVKRVLDSSALERCRILL